MSIVRNVIWLQKEEKKVIEKEETVLIHKLSPNTLISNNFSQLTTVL